MRRRLLACAAGTLAALVVLAPGASAQEEPDEGDEGPGQSIRGTLTFDDESGEAVPVEGASISVAVEGGDEVGTAETDDEGAWEVEVPEPGRYSATIDADSLPEDVSLRDEDRATLTFGVAPGQSRPVQFQVVSGEGGDRGGSSFADRVARLSVDGIKFGLIIAISAIGLSLIYGTIGLVNFAHGEMVTFGALIAFLFNVTWGMHLLIATPLAVVVGVLAGFGIDRGFWRPLNRRGTGLVALLVITIGIGLLVRYLFLYQFGGFTRTYAQYTLQREGLDIGPVTIVPRDLTILVVSIIVLIGVALFLETTKMGKAMRAVADDSDLAESTGIDVERVVGLIWASGAGLAALGGVFLGLSEQVDWLMGFRLLLLMFAGVILGGIGTAYGALVGSLVVGMVVQLSTLWVAPELKNVVALLILIIILVIRPQGILGQAERVG
ncbi:MAG TPA: branched-chain amino acid ABC transporter permease [Acidimicrobiales bacterium]